MKVCKNCKKGKLLFSSLRAPKTLAERITAGKMKRSSVSDGKNLEMSFKK
jgi:hypothetical protein